MSSSTGSDPGRGEYTTIERTDWALAVQALTSNDEALRDRALHRLLSIAPPGWGADDELRAGRP
ncbi:hypothetical protein [Actinomadura rugatobispora]|uniref:HEAT repeat domain-containing protein n=1 Tax=Actinomadura rugatobispora TaxID=1994 RepID=A0ABW0ZSK7_9ACTN|nr:hypothetical protein GCM10010200_036820 [Actinomadura rugatobispora]